MVSFNFKILAPLLTSELTAFWIISFSSLYFLSFHFTHYWYLMPILSMSLKLLPHNVLLISFPCLTKYMVLTFFRIFGLEDPEWSTSEYSFPHYKQKHTSEMCPLHFPPVHGHSDWRRQQQAWAPGDTANIGRKGILAFVVWHSLFGDLKSRTWLKWLLNVVFKITGQPSQQSRSNVWPIFVLSSPLTPLSSHQIILFFIFLFLKII